jgi:hypothetical protein
MVVSGTTVAPFCFAHSFAPDPHRKLERHVLEEVVEFGVSYMGGIRPRESKP